MRAPLTVALVGPTGSGKTATSEVLARTLGAEILCADSRQVYRELEIGTGKPPPSQRAALPHHLFDALEVGETASAGWYARACRECLAQVRGRGAPALLVGGSGLYLRACSQGLFREPPLDPGVRASLRREMSERGPEALHAELLDVDPGWASRLAPYDRQRIVRGLEVFRSTGRALSDWQRDARQEGAESEWIWLGLDVPPAALARRIERRAREMFEQGLIEEVRGLVQRGSSEALRRMRPIGYRQALDALEGRLSLSAAITDTALRTRQLAKRQRTWFRHQEAVEWIAAAEDESPEESARSLVRQLWTDAVRG